VYETYRSAAEVGTAHATRVERTLLDGDRSHAVIQQRMEFQEVMRDRFITDLIEAHELDAEPGATAER
jgi:hypothetical protein